MSKTLILASIPQRQILSIDTLYIGLDDNHEILYRFLELV